MDIPVEAPVAIDGDARRAPGPPYPPSLFDRLIHRIAALPGGGWWVYVLTVAVIVAAIEGARWLVLGVAPGSVGVTEIAWVVYGPYFVALAQYLDATASRAMDRFRPALDLPDDAIEDLRYELTTLPPRPMLAAFLSGAALGLAIVLLVPSELVEQFMPHASVELLAALEAFAVVNFAITAAILYHTARQLRLVTRIQAAAHHVDLYRPAPLYAFSALTARTGLGYALIAYYSIAWNSGASAASPFLIVIDGALVLAALACFALPLLGIHNRLAAEKARLLGDVDGRLGAARAALYRQVDSGRLEGMDQLDHSISALSAVRDRTSRLSTWPWDPGLLRGFVTALLLPIVLWLITRGLERTIGP